MKTVRLALTQPRSLRHPMHEFVVVHDGYEVSRLLHMNYVDGRSQTALFHVVGSPIDPYQAALEEADAVEEYEISRRQDEGFYLYVRGEPYEGDDRLVAAVRQRGLVTVMPVEFRADGTIRLTVVGPGDVVQESMGAIPDDIGVEVLAVGEYDARRFASGEGLTDRQYEAVQAAVDCGYYEEPRTGSVADVADELDCATGTAAELLRRAESTVMADSVADWS